MALMSSNLWSGTKTYTHDFTTKPTGTSWSLSGVNWTVSNTTNLNSYNSSYKGVQVGASNKNGSITLTTTNAWGEQTGSTFKGYTEVDSIRIWLNAGSATPSCSVSIGGASASSSGTVSKNTSPSNQRNGTSKLKFTPGTKTTGTITVTITTKSGAGYLCAIEVFCKEASSGSKYTVSFKTVA